MDIATEVARYPATGRFLMGRLRQVMTEDEKTVLESLVEEVVSFTDSHEVLRRGVACDRSAILIEGFMIRRMREHDRRFIVGVQVPGDFADLHCYTLKRLDHDVVTIGPAKVGYVPHARLNEVMRDRPRLARILWFSTLLDASIHRQWILKLQQLPATGRVAHLMAEMWVRFEMVGLARANGFDTPLTQADLADMCGTTPVHMNRSLGELRRGGMMEFRRGRVLVPDRAELCRAGDFDADYLYGDGLLQAALEFGAA